LRHERDMKIAELRNDYLGKILKAGGRQNWWSFNSLFFFGLGGLDLLMVLLCGRFMEAWDRL